MPYRLLLLCLIFLASYGVGSKKISQGVLVNPDKPGVYLTYDKLGCLQNSGWQNPGNKLRLVLHNNYRFSIVATIYNAGNDQLAMPYEIWSADDSRPQLIEQYGEEVGTGQRVEPDHQLRFCVSREHLTKSTFARIPFEIEAETNATRGGPSPEHFAINGEFLAER